MRRVRRKSGTLYENLPVRRILVVNHSASQSSSPSHGQNAAKYDEKDDQKEDAKEDEDEFDEEWHATAAWAGRVRLTGTAQEEKGDEK